MRKYISADEVRRLPLGTRVTIHQRDKYGYPTVIECELVGTVDGNARQLRYDYHDGFGYRAIVNKGRYSVEVQNG